MAHRDPKMMHGPNQCTKCVTPLSNLGIVHDGKCTRLLVARRSHDYINP